MESTYRTADVCGGMVGGQNAERAVRNDGGSGSECCVVHSNTQSLQRRPLMGTHLSSKRVFSQAV